MAYSPIPDIPGDLDVNAFGNTGGNGISQEVVVNAFNLARPYELPMLFYRHTKRMSFKNRLNMLGFRLPSKNARYGHFELPWHKNLVTVNAVITPAGGAGNPIVFNLPTADHYDAGVSVSGTGEKGSFPIVWETYKISGTEVEVYVSAKNTTTAPNNHRLTVYPKDITVDLDTYIVEGATMFLSGSMNSEATGLPGGRVPRVISYLNDDQIIKTTSGESGSAKTLVTKVSEGDTTYYELVVKDNMVRIHDDKVSNVLLHGTATTNTAIVQNSSKLGFDLTPSSTKGFIPSLESDSNVDTYPAGAYSTDDLYEMTDLLAANFTPTMQYMTMDGKQIFNKTEQVLNEFFKENLQDFLAMEWMTDERIDYDKFNMTSRENFVAKLGYRGVKIGGFDFLFTTLHEFLEPVGAGGGASTYPHYRILAPLSITEATEVESGENKPLFGYRYRALKGLDRELIVDNLPGAGSVRTGAVNEYDFDQVYMISHLGFHMIAANYFGLQKPEAE